MSRNPHDVVSEKERRNSAASREMIDREEGPPFQQPDPLPSQATLRPTGDEDIRLTYI